MAERAGVGPAKAGFGDQLPPGGRSMVDPGRIALPSSVCHTDALLLSYEPVIKTDKIMKLYLVPPWTGCKPHRIRSVSKFGSPDGCCPRFL